jgi:hypothetical protein
METSIVPLLWVRPSSSRHAPSVAVVQFPLPASTPLQAAVTVAPATGVPASASVTFAETAGRHHGPVVFEASVSFRANVAGSGSGGGGCPPATSQVPSPPKVVAFVNSSGPPDFVSS